MGEINLRTYLQNWRKHFTRNNHKIWFLMKYCEYWGYLSQPCLIIIRHCWGKENIMPYVTSIGNGFQIYFIKGCWLWAHSADMPQCFILQKPSYFPSHKKSRICCFFTQKNIKIYFSWHPENRNLFTFLQKHFWHPYLLFLYFTSRYLIRL